MLMPTAVQLLTTDLVVGPEHHGTVFMVDMTNSGGHLRFRSAAELTVGGTVPFLVGVKKWDTSGNQPVISSDVGELVDRVYQERKLRQTQESTWVTAFVDPRTGTGGLFTLGGSFNTGKLTGHRTVTYAGYNVSPHDYGILHRGVPSAVRDGAGVLAPQPVELFLPKLTDWCGTNPPIGDAAIDGKPAYLSKLFAAQKCDSSPHVVAIAAADLGGGAHEDIHTRFATPANPNGTWQVIYLRRLCDEVELLGTGDGWWACGREYDVIDPSTGQWLLA